MIPTPVCPSRRARAAGLAAGLVVTGAVLTVQPLTAPLAGQQLTAAPSLAAQVTVPPTVTQVPARTVRATPGRASRGGVRTAPVPLIRVTRTVATGPSFSGEASWYGGYFQGRRTANGERFDTNELTAASKTLPFGTRLKVCRTSRCVVVRINDRGPFVGGRVLDLSQAAALRLGYTGVAHVTATPVGTRTLTVVDTARQQVLQRQVAARQASHRAAQMRAQRARVAQVRAQRLQTTERSADLALASTDDSLGQPVALATGLVFAGAGGLLAARRRRTRS